MTWIFKPDGEVIEVTGWPSPTYTQCGIPVGSWGYPSPGGHWGKTDGFMWYFKEQPPAELRAKALLLGD